MCFLILRKVEKEMLRKNKGNFVGAGEELEDRKDYVNGEKEETFVYLYVIYK